MTHLWVVVWALALCSACSDGSRASDGGVEGGDGGDQAGADAGVTRDPHPHACTYRRDLDADGSDDWRSTYELDEAGKVLRDENDSDGDGELDFINHFTYDDAGRLELRELDDGADGHFEHEYRTEYRPDGQVEREADLHHGEEIASVDYVYDGDDFLVERIETVAESHAHGEGGSRTTYENDDDGCLIVTTLDDFDDGSIELIMTAEVDEACRPLRVESDRYGDGEIDSVWTTSYDDEGRVLTEVQVEGERMTLFRETTWDGDLKLRVIETHGTSTDVTEYFYDEAGNLERVEEDGFDDGHAIDTTVYEHDARGNVLRIAVDDGGDGTTDDISIYTYDCWDKA